MLDSSRETLLYGLLFEKLQRQRALERAWSLITTKCNGRLILHCFSKESLYLYIWIFVFVIHICTIFCICYNMFDYNKMQQEAAFALQCFFKKICQLWIVLCVFFVSVYFLFVCTFDFCICNDAFLHEFCLVLK